VLTGRKYRLAFTPEQAEFADTIGTICRSVWNTALEQRREYRRRGVWMNYVAQAGELADAKTEHEWLKAAPSHVLQQTLMDLDRACREHGTFKVRWRSGRRWNPSFRFPAGKQITVERLGRRWGGAKLPKLGWVRFRWSRALGGQVRSATVSRDGRHWYVSFLVEDGHTTPEQHASTTAAGVDRGVTVAVACSDGTMRDRQFSTPGEARRYLVLQKKLARQKKGSTNRKKTVAALRQVKRRERDRRQDFVSWTANRLATRHGMVAVEDLKTRNMTRSAKGTVEEPGSRVAQKAGLNRSILGKGWHKLHLALENVARYTGTTIVKVPPRVHVATLLSVPHRGPGKPREPSGISVHHLRIRRERGRERGKERTGRRAVGICLWRPRGYPVYEAGTRWEPARHYHPNRRLVRA
jgi:putative transposase